MKEQILDTVTLAAQDITATIAHYQDKIDTLETVVTVAVLAFAAVTFLAVRWGMKVYNARRNGVDMGKY